MRRLVVLVPLVLAACAGAAAVPSPGRELAQPDPLKLGNAAALATPGRTPTVSSLSIRSFASWSGQYLTPAGEAVTIRLADDLLEPIAGADPDQEAAMYETADDEEETSSDANLAPASGLQSPP